MLSRKAKNHIRTGGIVHNRRDDICIPESDARATEPRPNTALQELMDGNRRFMSNNMTHCDKDLAILRQHTAEGQEPFAAVLSCADSRIPIELIFDQTIGHIFVTRVAGGPLGPVKRR